MMAAILAKEKILWMAWENNTLRTRAYLKTYMTYKKYRSKCGKVVIAATGTMFFVNAALLAQSPTSTVQKSKSELIHDIQSDSIDDTAPKAVQLALQRHDIEVVTAGFLNHRALVKKLCLDGLDGFTDDQRKAALKSVLLNDEAWILSPSSAISTGQFQVNILFTEKLKRFGITVEPVELDSKAFREVVANRLMPAKPS